MPGSFSQIGLTDQDSPQADVQACPHYSHSWARSLAIET